MSAATGVQMITIDDRAGSVDIIPHLVKRGVQVEKGRLIYGDAAFVGNGPDGCPVPIGIEIKGVGDVLKCITDGRFTGHQLPGLVNSYQFVWLLVVGKIRPDMHSGVLQITGSRGFWHDCHIGQRKFMYRDLDHWLMTMEMRGGIRIKVAMDLIEASQWLADLYSWWTAKEWEEHKSHLAMHDDTSDRNRLVQPSLKRRIAAQLPGIGYEKSGLVAAHFDTIQEMVMASADDWCCIEGIGPTISKRIVAEVTGG